MWSAGPRFTSWQVQCAIRIHNSPNSQPRFAEKQKTSQNHILREWMILFRGIVLSDCFHSRQLCKGVALRRQERRQINLVLKSSVNRLLWLNRLNLTLCNDGLSIGGLLQHSIQLMNRLLLWKMSVRCSETIISRWTAAQRYFDDRWASLLFLHQFWTLYGALLYWRITLNSNTVLAPKGLGWYLCVYAMMNVDCTSLY